MKSVGQIRPRWVEMQDSEWLAATPPRRACQSAVLHHSCIDESLTHSGWAIRAFPAIRAGELKAELPIGEDRDGVTCVIGQVERLPQVLERRTGERENGCRTRSLIRFSGRAASRYTHTHSVGVTRGSRACVIIVRCCRRGGRVEDEAAARPIRPRLGLHQVHGQLEAIPCSTSELVPGGDGVFPVVEGQVDVILRCRDTDML